MQHRWWWSRNKILSMPILDQFLRFEELSEIPHLVKAQSHENGYLDERPLHDSLIHFFTGFPETLLSESLEVLFSSNGSDLLDHFSHMQLKLCKLVFLGNLFIILSMLTDLDFEVYSQSLPGILQHVERTRCVATHADHIFTIDIRRECELSL